MELVMPKRKPYLRKPSTKEKEIVIYKNDDVVLSRDSRNWIVSFQNSDVKYYYSNLVFFLQFLVDSVFTDSLLKKGLEDTISSISSLYKEARKALNSVADNIAEIEKEK